MASGILNKCALRDVQTPFQQKKKKTATTIKERMKDCAKKMLCIFYRQYDIWYFALILLTLFRLLAAFAFFYFTIFIFAHPAFLFSSHLIRFKQKQTQTGMKKLKKRANHIKCFAMKNSSVAEWAPADPHRFLISKNNFFHPYPFTFFPWWFLCACV